MKAFFWPQRRAENGVFVRFGRVIHWLCTGLSLAIVITGLSATAISVARVAVYQEPPPAKPKDSPPDPHQPIYDAIRRADAAGDADAVKRLGAYLKNDASNGDGPWTTYQNSDAKSVDSYANVAEPVTFSEPADPPPYVHWKGLWIGLAFGLPLFFVGRGIRYVLADE